MKKFFICCLLVTSACGKKSFEAAPMNQEVVISESNDSILQIHQITSGGGTVDAEDFSFTAETTIASVIYAPVSAGSDVLVSLGLFDILKNEF